MKHSFEISGRKILVTIAVISTVICLSCEKKPGTIPKSDFLTLPTVTAKNFSTVLDDSGKIDLEMSAPLMEQYDNKDLSYTEFRFGIKVIFYDGKKLPQGTVTAKYAKFTPKDNLWLLKDSVVVVNENNEKLETEVLNWDQAKDLIYTDRFVKMTSMDNIMQAFGFESDSHLNRRKYKKVSAIIYLDEK
jgi:LPS export ABC transporter protein LptC